MSPAFPTRRRADEFDRLVDLAASDRSARAADGLDELAHLARSLREVPTVEPGTAFSADLRERLMAAAATELATADRSPEESVADRLTVHSLTDPTRAARRQRRLTVGIAVAAIIGGTAGTAFASRGSLPGDSLYPVKRAVENVQTGFSIGDDAKGSTMLGEANTRLTEARQLTSSRPSVDSGQVRSTLKTFSDQATRASDLLLSNYRQHHDPASIKKLRTFVSDGIRQLSTLGADIPPSAKSALTEAAQTLVLIDQAASALCPDCGGPGITELPSTLLTGLSAPLDDLGLGSHDTTPQASQPKATQKQPHGTGSQAGSQPGISLPSVDPNSLLPGSVTGQGGDSGDAGGGDSATGDGSGSGSGGSGSGSGSDGSGGTSTGSGKGSIDPTATPTSLGDALGGTVDGVVDGVGGLVGGVVGGLTGSGN